MIWFGIQVIVVVIVVVSCFKIIGCVGVGVDNVDVFVVIQWGVLVVNLLEGNIIVVVEYVLVMMLIFLWYIFQVYGGMQVGKWDCKKYVGNEFYKKMLGVVGFGKIGIYIVWVVQVMGMEVIVYDFFIVVDWV